MPREVYVSTDIEADGPIPGRHSMLSFGSVAFDLDGIELGAFERNLETLPDAVGAPDTMEWWANHPEAWEACRRNTVNPREAMQDYVAWIDGLDGRPVFVAYPAAYDFMFVYWYLMTFVGRSPFSHSALDMKTLAMALMKSSYRAPRSGTCRANGSPRRLTPMSRWTTPVSRDSCSSRCSGKAAVKRDVSSRLTIVTSAVAAAAGEARVPVYGVSSC